MQIQRELDADIVMIFDECTPYPATRTRRPAASMELSLRWAARSRAAFARLSNPHALFGIVQGGMYHGSARGVARGSRRASASTATRSAACRSASRRRRCARDARGDRAADAGGSTALPDGRRHAARTWSRPSRARRRHVRLRHADPECAQRPAVHVDRRRSRSATPATRATRRRSIPRAPATPAAISRRAYLRHLDKCGEILAARLGTIHNLHQYLSLMLSMRAAIEQRRFDAFVADFYARRTQPTD